MYITVTSIKLRSVWYFFKLSLNGMQILKQTRTEKGFIKMKNTGFGYLHYTLSAWESEGDIKRFARSGAHANAMKQSKDLSTEIKIYTYQAAEMPGWKEAKELLNAKGRTLTFK
jgi:hypothetical protein